MNFTEFRICRSHWGYTLHSRLDVDEHLCTPWAIDVENPDKQVVTLTGFLPGSKLASSTMSDRHNILGALPDFSPSQLKAVALYLHGDDIGVQNTRRAFLDSAKALGSIVRPTGNYSGPEELAESLWDLHLRAEGMKLPEDIKARIAPELRGSTPSFSAPNFQPGETAFTQLPPQKVIETKIRDVEDSSNWNIGNDNSVINELYPGVNPFVQSTSGYGVSTPTSKIIKNDIRDVRNSKLWNFGSDNSYSNRFYLPLFILIPFLLVCCSILPRQ